MESKWTGRLAAASLLLLPAAAAAGWAAGMLGARHWLRRELEARRNGADAREPVVEQPAREPAPPEAAAPEELDEETLTVLSAAVAAFLGKPARIRRARLVSAPASTAWAQQGRAYVQASHNLPVRPHA